jgi:ribosome-associated translation inhibitor RaiA
VTIQFNTDKNINGSEGFTNPFIAQIEAALERYNDQITRVEVHLSDEGGKKDGNNAIRCLLEARLAGKKPINVSNQADTEDQAVSGAIDKLKSMLDTQIGRNRNY